MKTVTLYGTGVCPFCTQAENFLKAKGVSINKIRIDQRPDEQSIMMARSGRRTVPQLFVDEHHIGGFDDLIALDRQGQLGSLLED